jgi:hypothetical protein
VAVAELYDTGPTNASITLPFAPSTPTSSAATSGASASGRIINTTPDKGTLSSGSWTNLVDQLEFEPLSHQKCLELEVRLHSGFDPQDLAVKQQVMRVDIYLATSLVGLEETPVTWSLSSRTQSTPQ